MKATHDIGTEIPSHQISFDVGAFDEAIRSQGVRLVHYRALRCPVGMTDLDDNRRPHPDHEGCSNGFLYSKVGEITALFVNNSKRKSQEDVGFYDGSTVQASFPRTYDDPAAQPFYVAPFDRFYLEEASLVVPTWQLYLHHESGHDRLKYPVVEVEELIDNVGLKYTQEVDFRVTGQGQLEWIGRRPAQAIDVGPGMGNGFGTDRGAVCAIRYRYRPYWYVGQIMHELRVSQVSDLSGNRAIERMPQAVMLHREYVSTSRNQNEPGAPGGGSSGGTPSGDSADSVRTVLSAMNGGFGAK